MITQDPEGIEGKADTVRRLKVLNFLILETPKRRVFLENADLGGSLKSKPLWNLGLFTISPLTRRTAELSMGCLRSQALRAQSGELEYVGGAIIMPDLKHWRGPRLKIQTAGSHDGQSRASAELKETRLPPKKEQKCGVGVGVGCR